MAKQKSCVPDMVAATAGILTEVEARKMIGELSGKARERAAAKGIPIEEAVREVANELKQKIRLSLSVAKFMKARKLEAKANALRYLTTTKDKAGRINVLKNMDQLFENVFQNASYHGGKLQSEMFKMIGDVKIAEKMRKDTQLVDDVERELWNLSQEQPASGSVTGNKEAFVVASAYHRANSHGVDLINLRGGNIRKAPGWTRPQTHDQSLLIAAGGKDPDSTVRYDTSYKAWRESMDRKNIDWDRTLAGEDREEFFREFHKDIYYRNFKDDPDVEGNPYTRSGSLAKKVSAERKLWFKDVESQIAYNKEWGKHDLWDSMIVAMQQKGRTIALLQQFGPSPDETFSELTDVLIKQGKDNKVDPKIVTALTSNKYKQKLDVVSGRAHSTENMSRSKYFDMVKNWNLLSKGTNIVISAFGDRTFIATEALARGVPTLEAFGKSIIGRLNSSKDAGRLADSMGLFFHSYSGHIATRYMNQDRIAGPMAGGVNKLYSYTGMNYLNDVHRHIAGDLAAGNLGRNAGKTFSQLDYDFRGELESFGITEQDWDLIRAGKWTTESGQDVITPDIVDEIPDAKLDAYLVNRGVEPSSGGRKRLRKDLESKIGIYGQTWIHRSVPTPTVGQRRWMTLGGQPRGGWMRELNDLFWVFKGFPLAAAASVTRNVGGAFSTGHYGRGMFYLSSLIAQSFAIGYGVTVIKDFLKGRSPRRLMTDGEVHMDTLTAAVAQGGGLGIYGDFLFSEYDKRARTPLSAAAGPVYSSASDLITLGSRAARLAVGDEDLSPESIQYEAFRNLESNAPFINSFYTKPVLDYLIWWHLKESLSPGVIRRQQRSVEDKNHQEFWLEPVTY